MVKCLTKLTIHFIIKIYDTNGSLGAEEKYYGNELES